MGSLAKIDDFYNAEIKYLSIDEIKDIEDERLKMAVWNIYTFFKDIDYGNIVLGNDTCNYYYAYSNDEITIGDLANVLYSKGIKAPHFAHSSFLGYQRRTANALQNTGFTIDLDYYTIPEYEHLTPEEMVKTLKSEGAFDLIKPDYIIASGRGLYLVFLLKRLRVNTDYGDEAYHEDNRATRDRRRTVIKGLITHFMKYGADKKCHDVTRLNKLPGGIHSKSGNIVRILDFENIIDKEFKGRTLGHLYNYLDSKGILTHLEEPKNKKVKQKKQKQKRVKQLEIKEVKEVKEVSNYTTTEKKPYYIYIDEMPTLRDRKSVV